MKNKRLRVYHMLIVKTRSE